MHMLPSLLYDNMNKTGEGISNQNAAMPCQDRSKMQCFMNPYDRQCPLFCEQIVERVLQSCRLLATAISSSLVLEFRRSEKLRLTLHRTRYSFAM